MRNGKEEIHLRVYTVESAKLEGKAFYEALVMEARKTGISGATVYRGIQGYGLHGHLHNAHIVDLSSDLPVTVEIVDTEERVSALLNWLEPRLAKGFYTTSRVTAFRPSADQATL